MNNPEYVKIGDKKYKINTDFRVAISCQQIAIDDEIGDTERALAIIYKLFGDEALKEENVKDWIKLQELAIRYLNLDDNRPNNDGEPDMDLIEDKKYIRSSFVQDYKYNPYDLEYLHWWDFYNDLSNLSNSELGNCCILNRIRNLRTFDVSKIKDSKEKSRIIEEKKKVALKLTIEKEILSCDEKKNQDEFYRALGGD